MAQQPVTLTMLSPLPVYLDETTEGTALAPRPETLDGHVVGLLPNWRPSAVKLLEAVGQILSLSCTGSGHGAASSRTATTHRWAYRCSGRHPR